MSLRDQNGFTLPEVLLVMIIFVVVLLATLSVFDASNQLSSNNQRQNDAVEQSRTTIDQVTRQLRNLASPTTPTSTIDTATGYDLIFQTDDPSRTWVRYCLLTTGSGTSAVGTLYYASSANSTLSSGQRSSPCPGTGWSTVTHVASGVTNQTNGQDRPVFSYGCTSGAPASCPSSSSDNSKIVLTHVDLFVDVNPGKAPSERRVSSGIYLRNQNQAPTASFTVTPQQSGSRTVILNGSASSDPEGRTLKYYWCENASGDCAPASSLPFIGEGVTLTYTFPASDGGAQQQMKLTVVDPGGLSNSTTQQVTPP